MVGCLGIWLLLAVLSYLQRPLVLKEKFFFQTGQGGRFKQNRALFDRFLFKSVAAGGGGRALFFVLLLLVVGHSAGGEHRDEKCLLGELGEGRKARQPRLGD